MKKIVLIAAMLFILVLKNSAQRNSYVDYERKGYLGFGIGTAIPFAAFASKDPSDPESGFANIGGCIQIEFAYKFSERFGIASLAFGTINPFDENQLEYAGADISYQINSDPWKCIGFMAGGYYTSALTPAAFEMRLMVGYVKAISPADHHSFYKAEINDYIFAYTEESRAGSITGDLGLGVKVKLSEIISFISHMDFWVALPRFVNQKTYENGLLHYFPTYDQPINNMNLTLGIAVNIK